MNTFYLCPFRYYCDNILKLNKFEDTFDTWTGSLCHYILSKIYYQDYNYQIIKDEYIKSHPFPLTDENKVFLNKILNELQEAIKYIKSLTKINKYQDIECEKSLELTIDDIKFKGIIDKIMHYKNNYVLIDYKTGNPDIDLRLAKYGLNLQLPIYIYLIKQIYPDSQIVGIYLQHILKPNFNKDENKTEKEQQDEALKLIGYTIGNEDLINDFDPTYENSAYIKGLKRTNNGFSQNAKLLTEKDFLKLEKVTKQKISECIYEIKNTNFSVKPKILGTTNLSCEYCSYKSLCFMTEKDKEYIELDQDLSILGDGN